MKRRDFFSYISFGVVGALFPSSLVHCSNDIYTLARIIGKNWDDLINRDFERNGNEYFAFFTLNKGDFEHPYVDGDKALVYCREETVVGYRILLKSNAEADSVIKRIDEIGSEKQKIYENEFGTKFQWKTENGNIALSLVNCISNLSPYMVFSEFSDESNLVVF
ncbi:hypothetical protein [Sinomicrobium sp.]